MTWRVLNLYAGIGGNRKLWEDVNVTAVEINQEIADIYRDHFPEDKVVVADAHEYLREHFQEFDFIWSSPPCQTHSQIRNIAGVGRGQSDPVYPDMKLYEEIIFLRQAFESSWRSWQGEFCVENVNSYYDPLITPQEIERHYMWASFKIPNVDVEPKNINHMRNADKKHGFNLQYYELKQQRKGTILRNAVHPKIGKAVLEAAKKGIKQDTLEEIAQ